MKRFFAVSAGSALLVLLAGCIESGGTKPHSTLISQTTLQAGSATPSADPTASWPDQSWWKIRGDPQLDALVVEAIANHPDVRIAQARLDLARAQARMAGAATQPQLGATVDLSRQRFARYTTPSPPGGFTTWNNATSLDLAYDLDLWGKNRADLKGAIDSASATAAELQGVRIALEVAVARTYIQFWLQYQLLDVYKSLYRQSVQTRTIVAARNEAGLSNQLELSQADAQVAISASDLERTKGQLALLRNQLGTLSGQGPGAGSTLSRPSLTAAKAVLLPPSIPADLVGHRADIVAQRWRVEAATQGIKAAHAAFYPNIDLVALASLGSSTTFGGFFNFLDKEGAGHQFGAALSLPLFDGGRLHGQYSASVATYDAAVETYNQTVLDALQQVADQVVSMRALQHQEAEVRNAVSASDRAYQLATQGYRGGITEYLEVLVTQDTQARQKQLLVVTNAQQLDAWVVLVHALGGGYVTQTHDRSSATGAPEKDHAS